MDTKIFRHERRLKGDLFSQESGLYLSSRNIILAGTSIAYQTCELCRKYVRPGEGRKSNEIVLQFSCQAEYFLTNSKPFSVGKFV